VHFRLLLVVAGALAILPLHADGASPDLPQPPALFAPATARSAYSTNDAAVTRSQAVTVRLDLLPATGQQASRVRLDLFGTSVVADLSRGVSAGGQTTNWQGPLEGIAGSYVGLTADADAVAGTIDLAGALYRLSPATGGTQLLEQLQPGAFPPDGPPVPVPGDGPGSQADTTTAVGGPVIDVLVVYTPAARVGAGGTTGIIATIAEGISESNIAYANSGVTQRVRLVHTAEVNYVESGAGQTELARLRDPADGYLDDVPGIRDQYGADLVVLVDETLDNPPECGRAYEMSTPSASSASSAFAVVKRTCITGQYSLTHEMAHNMGASHDRSTGCSGAYTYSCGYQDPANRFRTIMAYDCPVSCPRVLYFSNPAVTYLGLPTGIADNLPNAADNARTLTNTAAIVSNFRPSILGVALAFNSSPATTTPGAAFAVQVSVRNSANATVVADQATVVTLAVAVGPGMLTCDSQARTVTSGVATFTGCRVSANGFYQLTATADLPMTPATSAAISVGAFRVPVAVVASDTGVG